MITKFLSQPMNLNLLIVLVLYFIMMMGYGGVDTAFEALIFSLLLCINNVLFYIRGMAYIIYQREIDRDDT